MSVIVDAKTAAIRTGATCGYCGGIMPPGKWILQEGWCPCGRRRIESLGDGRVRVSSRSRPTRRCNECGQEKPHHSRGLCRSCYERTAGTNVREGRRGEIKRQWDIENRAYCACGARCSRRYERCDDCRRLARRVARDERRDRIAQLYRDGLPLLEIARRLGSTRNSIGVELAHMRADGWDLPHRHRGYDRPR